MFRMGTSSLAKVISLFIPLTGKTRVELTDHMWLVACGEAETPVSVIECLFTVFYKTNLARRVSRLGCVC